MKRIIIFASCIIILFLSMPVSLAYYSNDPVNVTSPLTRPVPEINVSGSNTNYVQYYVQQLFSSPTPVTRLFKINFTIPSSCSVILRNDNWNTTSVYTSYDQVINYNVTTYDLSTGELVSSDNFSSTLDTSLTGYNSSLRFRNGYFIYNMGYEYGDAFGFPIINIPITSSYTYSTSNYQINNNISDFITWYVPHSDTVIRSNLPQPLSDLHHMYFADNKYLYQLHIADPYLYWYNSVEITNNGIVYNHNEGMYPVVVNFSRYNNNTIQLEFLNYQTIAFNVYLSVYDVITGEYKYTNTINIPSNTLVTDTPTPVTRTVIVNDADTSGLWYVGLLNADGLNNYDKLKISWSDTIDYSSDFQIISSLLTNIENDFIQLNSYVSDINDNVNLIKSTLNSLYSIISADFQWFKTTYYNTIINKWDITKDQLDSIITILQGDGTQTTLPIDESVADDVNNYVNEESGYMNDFDSAGSDLDNVFGEAVQNFQTLTNGFAFVKMLFETYVLNISYPYLIVFFSLTFGLVVLIIGRKLGG